MFRVATPADAEAIARVHVATWRAAYAGLVPDAVLAGLNVAANAARWEGLLADGERRVWITAPTTAAPEPTDRSVGSGYVRGGVGAVSGVEGFVAAGPARDDDLPDTFGEVYAAYVLPAAQRRGAGRALVDAALAWLGQTGRREAAVWTLRDNAAARTFYEATGWDPDGHERESDIGGALVPEVRYQRMISSSTAT